MITKPWHPLEDANAVDMIINGATLRDVSAKLGRSYEATKKRSQERRWRHSFPITTDTAEEEIQNPVEKRSILTENRQLKERNNLYDLIGSSILSKITPFDPVEIDIISQDSHNDEEVFVALFSDHQVGEKISSVETGGLGEYSTEIFKERLWDWCRGIVHIKATRNVNVKVLHVDDLGDNLDNVGIYKGQAHHIDSGLTKQFMSFFEETCLVYAELLKHFDEVVVNKVVGNHGRIGQYGENPVMDNMEYLLYKMIEKKFEHEPRIRFNIAESWWMVVERCGWRFLLSHGDTFKSWLGIPFYGALRNKQRMDDLLSGSFNGAHFDFVEHGHFHTYAMFNGVFMNGCFPGTNEFSSRMGAGGIPMQLLLGVHSEFGVRYMHPIYLSMPNEKPDMPVYQ